MIPSLVSSRRPIRVNCGRRVKTKRVRAAGGRKRDSNPSIGPRLLFDSVRKLCIICEDDDLWYKENGALRSFAEQLGKFVPLVVGDEHMLTLFYQLWKMNS